MAEREIMVEPIQHIPAGINARQNPHVMALATMLEIARMDYAGERIGNQKRRKLVQKLPVTLGAFKIDDFMDDDPTAQRHSAVELLLTDAIESTSIIQEEVQRTVVAGAEKFKIIRDAGVAWYNMKSGNALRVPLGEAQINAPVIPEAAEIPDRTQNYDKRDFTIVKYGMKPRISFEMIEDGLVDVVAEEFFFAGAAVENKLNYDALTALCTNAGNITTQTGCNTAGTAMSVLRQAKKMLKSNGFFADTLILHSEFEADLLANATFTTPYGGTVGDMAIRQGTLPSPLYGMKWYITDNGSTTVDGTNPWDYDTDHDIGGIMMEAKRGCGVAMRRDRTVKKFDDIAKELNTITVTMRCDVNYLHANAVGKLMWHTA